MAKRKSKQPPPLVPHSPVNYTGNPVAVVKIPKDTPNDVRQRVMKELWNLGTKLSKPWEYDR